MPVIHTAAIAAAASSPALSTPARDERAHSRGRRSSAAPLAPGESQADQEIDEIVARISAKHAVRGVIVVDMVDHNIVRSSLIDGEDGGVIKGQTPGPGEHARGEEDAGLVSKYAALCVEFVEAANKVTSQFFEEEDGLKLLRLRTKDHELMIVPDSRFILAVIHDIH